MDAGRLTYEKLFALLTNLGFCESARNEDAPNAPRVFIHDRTDTVVLFRNASSEPVSPSDLLSAEVHLHASKIVREPLESLMQAATDTPT